MTSAGRHPPYAGPRRDRSPVRGWWAIGGVFAALAVLVAAMPPPDPSVLDGSVLDGSVLDGSVPDGSVPDGSVDPAAALQEPAHETVVVVDLAATCTHPVVDLDTLHTALLAATEGEVFCLRGADRAPMAVSAVAFARAALGTPYVWGGNGEPDGGFDCSGLTTAAYASAGLRLPRTAQTQYDAIPHLRPGVPAQPGDLAFFGAGPRSVTHVGIVISETLMINAPRRGEVVKIASLRRADLLALARPTDLPAGEGY